MLSTLSNITPAHNDAGYDVTIPSKCTHDMTRDQSPPRLLIITNINNINLRLNDGNRMSLRKVMCV